MIKDITRFFDQLVNSKYFLSTVLELFAIVVIAVGITFLSSLILKQIEDKRRLKFKKYTLNFFDVEPKTFISVVLVTFCLWLTQIVLSLYKIDTLLLEHGYLILFSWFVIRGVTYSLDQSLLSRFVANVLWVTAALFLTGNLNDFSKTLKTYSYKIGAFQLSLHTFVHGIIVFSVLLWLSSLVAMLVSRVLKKNKGINKTQHVLIMKILRIALYTAVFLGSFHVIGFDLTTLTIFGGAVAFGVGFGLQKIFSNLISGLILLLDKSIRPGDVIAMANTYGEVKKLDARYVSVVTRDGKKHLIPNETLISERVENWSYSDDKIRLHIPVGVSYDSDVKKVRELMLEAADEASERILNDPAPVCLLSGFGDSAINFELRVWINDPYNGCEAPRSDVLLKIWEKFKEHKITFPFPQRDVHLIDHRK